MHDAHRKDVHEVATFYSVDVVQGLSEAQVQKARKRYGRNELPPEPETPLWKLILKQFDDLLVKILLAAAVVDFIIALSDGEGILNGMVEPAVILTILIANATVGVITERNADAAIEELKAYEAESATVMRNGQLSVVPSVDLVPGDVVEVVVGAKVPADMRLCSIYSQTFRVDQSILTGESNSVDKRLDTVLREAAVYQDKTCMLFSGTMVTSGRARGIVIGTGPNTAIGKIRDAMLEQEEAITPLKAKLDEFGNLLSRVIAGICVLVWVININRFNDPALGGWASGALYYFKIAVALAVAAIPEGLPAVVTTCLALGTRKMAKHNAIVRHLKSVETLGCTTVICSDKTGTLTTNQMTVAKVALVQSSTAAITEFEVSGNTYSREGQLRNAADGQVLQRPADSACLLHLAMCSALCNDSAVVFNPETGAYQRIGEATELALRVLVEKVGLPSEVATPASAAAQGHREFAANTHWQESFGRNEVLEFSRDRKMMSVLATGNGKRVIWTKGAPENVLRRCTSVMTGGREGVVPLTDAMRHALTEKLAQYGGSSALRCLALAFRVHSSSSSMDLLKFETEPTSSPQLSTNDESNLTFIGLVGMHDPPRSECRQALQTCQAAGIRVVMVTGDNKATAEAVCRHIGALPGGIPMGSDPFRSSTGTSLTGAEFDGMSPREQSAAMESIVVFSRVEPTHKLRLVELLRAQGHVVAMTGDGVNDAPALMRADIGIAMGSGTAVARSASDMVLADDNFATIVLAVAEGRSIYNNTKQFIRYMISSNIGEVVAIFLAALLGCPEVLTPVQLLWVNLVTDGLPATALGFNRPDKDIMTQSPRRIDEPIVNGWLFVRYAVIGAYVGLATVGGYLWWFLSYSQGGHVPWSGLVTFQKCTDAAAKAEGYSCSVFESRHPRTIAMTVLVVVEMFNALNNLSEDASLLTIPPWDNRWLLGAISTSMALHFFILYVPAAAALFGVTGLDRAEWATVVYLSAPVILIDEVMKVVSRRRRGVRSGTGGGAVGLGGGSSGSRARAAEMVGIQVLGGGSAGKWH